MFCIRTFFICPAEFVLLNMVLCSQNFSLSVFNPLVLLCGFLLKNKRTQSNFTTPDKRNEPFQYGLPLEATSLSPWKVPRGKLERNCAFQLHKSFIFNIVDQSNCNPSSEKCTVLFDMKNVYFLNLAYKKSFFQIWHETNVHFSSLT